MKFKYFPIVLCLMWIAFDANSQTSNSYLDSLITELSLPKDDSTRIDLLSEICTEMAYEDAQKACGYGHKAFLLAEKIGWQRGMSTAYNNLGIAHYISSNYDSAIYFTNKSIEIDRLTKDSIDIHKSLNNLGLMYEALGDFENAKKSHEASLAIREMQNDSSGIANTYNNLSGIYSSMGDMKAMLMADIKALKIREKLNDPASLCQSYINISLDYIKLKDYNEALAYSQKALNLAVSMEDKHQTALAHNTLGIVYLSQSKTKEARNELLKSVQLSVELGNLKTAADSYCNIAQSFRNEGKFNEALIWLDKALETSREIEAEYDVMTYLHQKGSNYASLRQFDKSLACYTEALPIALVDSALADLEIIYSGLQVSHAGLGQFNESYKYTLLYNAVHDSLHNQNASRQLSFIRTEFETEKKQHQIDILNKDNELQVKEISKQKLIRNSTIAGLGGLAIFLGIVFVQKRKITKEKDRSENLLLNILPYETAQELKEKGSADAKLFDEVTVLFTDFKGFTMVAEQLSPTELVAEIHHCFKAYDEIMAQHNIEKIKTIGDAYMAAGGLPVMNKTNAKDVIEAAFKIQSFMLNYKLQREAEGKSIFEIRIGIHTGPVVAGIVGIKKFQYDIWGDTVNTASRMESSGEAGKVNISGATYELIKDSYSCTYRGKVNAKNKGEIDMYFVENKM